MREETYGNDGRCRKHNFQCEIFFTGDMQATCKYCAWEVGRHHVLRIFIPNLLTKVLDQQAQVPAAHGPVCIPIRSFRISSGR